MLQRLPTVPRLWRRTAAFWIAVVALGSAIIAVPTLIHESWRDRAPEGVHLSMLAQGDMPTYVCYARMAARSPTLLSWANAHDLRDPPVPVFVNLPITVLGWLAASGLEAAQIDLVSRIGFGLLMYLALASMLLAAHARGIWFWGGFLLIAIGGGATWLAEIDPGDTLDRLAGSVQARQHPWYWWSLDLVRPLLYPLELAYHASFFAMIAATMKRRFGWANLFFAIGCASNPFLGIQMAGVQLASLALIKRTPLRARIGGLIVTIGFFAYYLLLRLDETGLALIEQHTGVWPEPLSFDGFTVGHGLALLGPFGFVADARFRRRYLADATAIPILALLCWTAVLVSHSRFFPTPVIPMHFTRGYLWVAGWMVGLAWLRHRFPPFRAAPALRVIAVLLVLVIPDTFFFLRANYQQSPHEPILAWPDASEEVFTYLRADRGRVRRIVADDWFTGPHICATTWHRTAFGTLYTTPDWYGRREQLRRFRSNPSRLPPVLRWADTVLVSPGDTALARGIERHGFRPVLRNEEWIVYEVLR
jgi:hypothetical protein